MNANSKIEINLRGDIYDIEKNISEETATNTCSGMAMNTALDVLNAALVALDKIGASRTEAGYKLSYAIAELNNMK